tara:strand:+ start:1045 stop:1374 length:330 start_codon:yes stop_codon:yes gene_type:complete
VTLAIVSNTGPNRGEATTITTGVTPLLRDVSVLVSIDICCEQSIGEIRPVGGDDFSCGQVVGRIGWLVEALRRTRSFNSDPCLVLPWKTGSICQALTLPIGTLKPTEIA